MKRVSWKWANSKGFTRLFNRQKMVCEVSFLFNCFVSPSIFWHLKTEYVFFWLSVGGSVVNKAVITTNCSIKVGWRPFVRGPSLVSSKVDTSWPMKSPFWLSCHHRRLALFLCCSYIFRLTLSTALSSHFSFLSVGQAVSCSDCPGQSCQISATSVWIFIVSTTALIHRTEAIFAVVVTATFLLRPS